MAEVWITAGVAAVGVGASIYGANKQAKATKQANDANLAAQEKANQQEWAGYLLQRGIAAPADTATGALPTSGTAVNTKLPLWASVQRTTTSPLTLRRKGAATRPTDATMRMSRASFALPAAPAAPAEDAAAAPGQEKKKFKPLIARTPVGKLLGKIF